MQPFLKITESGAQQMFGRRPFTARSLRMKQLCRGIADAKEWSVDKVSLRSQSGADGWAGSTRTRGSRMPSRRGRSIRYRRKMEAIRSHAGVVCGVAGDEHSVDLEWPVTPFSAIVMPPCDYTTIQGEKIKAPDMSLRAIIWAAHQYHPACSGRICAATGVGALIPGTVVNEVLADETKKTGETKIGHPSGIMECDAVVEMKDGQAIPRKAIYYRTARRIMEGCVYLKPWTMSQDLHI